MSALFDLLYAASTEEVASSQLRKDKQKNVIEPIRSEERVETKGGKESRRTFYIYPQVVPRLEPLLDVDPTRDGSNGVWTKLARDSLWQILRGVPAQRLPYEVRATRGKPVDGVETYRELALGPDEGVPLPSTFFLGAMEWSPENVAFRDRARFQFLLHAWPLVTSIYVPEVEDREGKREFSGYAFVIPDVAALRSFCEVWGPAMKERGTERAAFRPREAVVCLSTEGGLAAASRLRSRLSVLSDRVDLSGLVLGFDVIHADKPGNAVKLVDVARVEPSAPMIDRYEQVRTLLWDPAFRRQSIVNLLAGAAWFEGFARLLRTLPSERVLGGAFAHDARVTFEARLPERSEDPMNEAKKPAELEELLLRVVTNYLTGRARARGGATWDEVKDDPDRRGEYDEAKEKNARGAFLAVRSRTGSDFVDYFAGTLCSVPQRLSREDFATLSRALRDRPDDVRTLTLLALSARS